MKRALSLLLLLALSVTLVPAAYADGACTNAMLSGKYSFKYSGWLPTIDKKGRLVLPNSMIVDIVGVATFDGAGNFTASWNFCGNGACSNGSQNGTYSVNSDCSGAATLGSGQNAANYGLAISNGGSQLYVIETDAGSNISGTATKQ
jgi:hypothetical protein